MFTPVRPPYLIRRYYNEFTWNLPGEGRNVYLTFDDGPVPGVTDFVLDTLKSYRVKATFFCVGNNVKNHPGIFNRIIDEGHRTGNHTFLHTNGWRTTEADYLQDVEAAASYIQSNLFRPPYGRIKNGQAKALMTNYRIVMWDVLSYDFQQSITTRQCLDNVTLHTRPGSIIVFHDNLKSFSKVKEVLPQYLKYLLKNELVPAILP